MTPMMAARAYSAVAQSVKPGGASATEPKGPDFASMVNQAMTDSVGSARKAETLMTQHAQGRAELLDVVTAVSSAQASLETVMAVRDQVISAYKEIMAMPI
ncbi:MAG: flagellar hook-basal body complex protein FliE [Caulobacteraceae bacterium]|nr:flagellar hook-basal body complex protein FliE [Caulobacter sp.]